MNKRGQALSMQTIIIIILAIIVLVFIVLYFTGRLGELGWRILREYSESDIKAAQMECGLRSIDGFCTLPARLWSEKRKEYVEIMCYESPISAAIRIDNETINSRMDCEAHGYIIE